MNITRRHFIKGTTAMLGLPWLESLGGFAHAADAKAEPRRVVLINVPLGLYRDAFMPKDAGARHADSEYLSILNEFRDRFTVISGLDHPGVGGGHASEARIFTGVPSNARNARSLDQYRAAHRGPLLRLHQHAQCLGT